MLNHEVVSWSDASLGYGTSSDLLEERDWQAVTVELAGGVGQVGRGLERKSYAHGKIFFRRKTLTGKGLSFVDFLRLGQEQWIGCSHPLNGCSSAVLGLLSSRAIRNAHVLRVIKELPLPSEAREC